MKFYTHLTEVAKFTPTKDFVLGGKCIFTIANDKGDHYTFKVSAKDKNDVHNGLYFVSVLTGPDNNSNYTYLGLLNAETGRIRLTAKSRYLEDSLPVKVARYAMNVIWNRAKLPSGYMIRHEGKCSRCGRKLTHPTSLISGIGPECAQIRIKLKK